MRGNDCFDAVFGPKGYFSDTDCFKAVCTALLKIYIFCRNGAVQMNLQTYVFTKPAESVNRERMCPGSVPAGFTVLLSFQVLRRKSVNASYSPFISPVWPLAQKLFTFAFFFVYWVYRTYPERVKWPKRTGAVYRNLYRFRKVFRIIEGFEAEADRAARSTVRRVSLQGAWKMRFL